ncbi:hypothetical protein PAXRUDRAFT_716004 [Paxillus rubicundulus Ve08.2h10]|uniref:Uncharacterized protein n=1 Tax=Paxillus rubicundulus Ve08.2h10 TaxID=930991 RepID=A0A0D0DKY8_9AGAM|nr:hypothetical protein PAXRUDRAFT_716004 [Paxillus rubicundulus Ve08.2h10]
MTIEGDLVSLSFETFKLYQWVYLFLIELQDRGMLLATMMPDPFSVFVGNFGSHVFPQLLDEAAAELLSDGLVQW